MTNSITSLAASSTIQLQASSCTLDQLTVECQVYILRRTSLRPLLNTNCLHFLHKHNKALVSSNNKGLQPGSQRARLFDLFAKFAFWTQIK